MVVARTMDLDVMRRLTHGQRDAVESVVTLIEDLGEDCEVYLDNDESPSEFDILFTGTTLSLSFDKEVISVVDFNLETGEDEELAYFDRNEINKATHWLLTQANHQNVTS